MHGFYELAACKQIRFRIFWLWHSKGCTFKSKCFAIVKFPLGECYKCRLNRFFKPVNTVFKLLGSVSLPLEKKAHFDWIASLGYSSIPRRRVLLCNRLNRLIAPSECASYHKQIRKLPPRESLSSWYLTREITDNSVLNEPFYILLHLISTGGIPVGGTLFFLF